jgi:hypothetical protein
MTASKIQSMASVIGGLVTQERRRAQETRFAWPLHQNPSPDACIPPAQCWRSVSKRTLTQQVAWSAQFALLPLAAKPVYEQGLDALELPYIPLTDPKATSTSEIAPFYDNNNPDERGSIDNLVLIGLRASITFAYGGKQDVAAGPFRRSNEWAKAYPEFLGHYLNFRLTHTSGRRDPWVFDTPLRYIDRPDQGFLATPPLIWNTRDTSAYWVSRPPDGGGSPLNRPVLQQGPGGDNVAIPVTATVDVEGLFVPDPARCGADWPGLWCPPQAIRGHRDFDPDFMRHRRAKLDQLAATLDSFR